MYFLPKLVVKTAFIKGIEIPTKDIPSDISQCDSESDKSDSDSKYIPHILLICGIHQNQPGVKNGNNERIELPSITMSSLKSTNYDDSTQASTRIPSSCANDSQLPSRRTRTKHSMN